MCRTPFVHALSMFVCFTPAVALRMDGHADKLPTLKQVLPFYHTNDELVNIYEAYGKNCRGANIKLENLTQGKVTLLAITFKHPSRKNSSKPKIQALYFFGIHPRELITTETGVAFAREMCSGRAAGALEKVDFTIVPNANPHGRRLVEKGDFCQRTNGRNVDINRNWPLKWQSIQEEHDSTNPGPSAFSEPESQLLRDLAARLQPKVFVDVHSGAYLLGTPWGYSKEKTPDNMELLEKILKPISQRFCGGNCPYGNAAKLVDYDAPGVDMDYIMSRLHVNYSFTFEIFAGARYMSRYTQLAKAQATAQATAALLEELGPPKVSKTSSECIHQFTPLSKRELQSVSYNWATALLELARSIAFIDKADASA
eukprot:TRINITY_DN4865_c0_g1_i1.p1 TRINITY_DN4865_c0_g1~~TRINITY_DN4865_c0_g1_i1.p1  ORF type:complete len:370 (+),score=39.49 TRINITY_DN4865_c0_g1_i1:70-1179(+)